ncbi:hypothetical protein NW762_009479 [Fusarium torreyae]|uniref:Uncharacterized protein n=1 Tax=Fusarium torreyae TaxID=1237075 RepID=A0A9W8RXD0_9HYPO|nr:hypothetical protein NW762_009479 [Fusarium torreyae]
MATQTASVNDKRGLYDLAVDYAFVAVNQQRAERQSSKQLLEDFYAAIFGSWSTVEENNTYPKIPKNILKDTSKRVGVLGVACPPRVDGGSISDARRPGEPVFLGVSLKRETDCIEWMWKDKEGNFVKFEYVTLDPGLTTVDARVKAIRNYDKCQRKRISTLNIERIVCAARRRLVKWARLGSSVQLTYDPEDVAGYIVPLFLARDSCVAMDVMYKQTYSCLDHGVDESSEGNEDDD